MGSLFSPLSSISAPLGTVYALVFITGVRTSPAVGAPAFSNRVLIRPAYCLSPPPAASRKDHLHALLPSHGQTAKRTRSLALSLATLGLTTLAPTAVRAQTQDLFVSNGGVGQGSNTISRFAGTGPGTFATTATTVPDPDGGHAFIPQGLAFDTRGDLLVANAGNGSITEFSAGITPGTLGPASTVKSSLLYGPGGLAFDTQGDLFAANAAPGGGDIVEVAAGTTPGTFGSVTSLPDPRFPGGLAFDASGDLFVANDLGGSNNQGSITEFAAGSTPGTFGVTTTFSDPSLNIPTGLAFDARGDLFVANGFGNSNKISTITEFSAGPTPGTFGTTSTLTDPSLHGLIGLAVDARGDLFAANYGNGQSGQGTIMEFASTGAGTFGMAMTVETGLSGPTFLTFGPSAPPSVPEASTTVSLGLLLALGMGGMAVAARKKREA